MPRRARRAPICDWTFSCRLPPLSRVRSTRRRAARCAALDARSRPNAAVELHLRLAPQAARNTKPLGACLGQVQLLAAAIQRPVLDADEAVTLQRQHGTSQRRTIHDQLARERVDRQRSQPFQLRQDRKLRRAQPGRRQALVVELGDVTGGLAQRQAIAFRGRGERFRKAFRLL